MICAFDIGGSKIAAALVGDDLVPRPLGRVVTPAKDYAGFVETVARLMPPAARALSLSLAGIVDAAAGRVRAANIPCLAGRELAADPAARLGRPVYLVNDAKAFALAEARVGGTAQSLRSFWAQGSAARWFWTAGCIRGRADRPGNGATARRLQRAPGGCCRA